MLRTELEDIKRSLDAWVMISSVESRIVTNVPGFFQVVETA